MGAWYPLDVVRVTGEFGNSPDFYWPQKGHNGIDMGCPIGTPVYAIEDGTVAFEGWGQNHSWMGAIAGICALIRHWFGHSGYAHLSSTIIDKGQWVKKGQLIGYSGNTGGSTGPHLHVEELPLNPNFANGYAGRVNPATLAPMSPRGSGDNPTPAPPTASGGQPMFDVFWTGPAVNNTQVSGRYINGLGTFPIFNMQIYGLLLRRKNAALKPGATDNMLDQEAAILNSFQSTCLKSALTGIGLDPAKQLKAINDGFAALGKNIVITPESVNIDADDLLAAFDVATPRIARAMLREQGIELAKIKAEK